MEGKKKKWCKNPDCHDGIIVIDQDRGEKCEICNDPCRIEHAQICLVCENITIEKCGGLRGQICTDCHEKWKETFKHWNEYGLYATTKELTKHQGATK